jgi:hypothetical protein
VCCSHQRRPAHLCHIRIEHRCAGGLRYQRPKTRRILITATGFLQS